MHNKYLSPLKQLLLLAGLSLAGVACKKDTDAVPAVPVANRFGEVTSAVVIVNPVINQGSATTVTSGTQRGNVAVQAGSMVPVSTDATGLAVLEAIPTGAVPLKFSTGNISLNVVQPKELYDVVVSVKDNGVQEVISAVRYPIGGQVIVLAPGANISQAAAVDNAIIYLAKGVYPGDVEVRGTGVLIFGEWSPVDGQLSAIEGNLTVQGTGSRLRGLKVNGKITASANAFSAAFCHFGDAAITGNGNSLIRNTFTGSQVTVPSSSAVLVDNVGIR